MKNILEQLTDLLKKDERLVSQDGVLLKNHTQELARKNDPALIKLLLSDNAIKQHFFFEVEKTLIFDKEKFIRFVSNKRFLPDSYTAFKNKIGLTASDEYVSESKEVVLAWPYKDCVLEGGMTKEDQKRDEIFYNETLAPDDINRLLDAKVFTNFKRIDKKGEHELDGFNRDEKGTIKDNLIIKGNNLLALASLKKEFAGKVELIYIDPPYNRDAETFYNDRFKRSSWLSFMKNRLWMAKNLLSDSAAIFISIDDRQHAYLKVLCDDIFGEENFVTTICIKTSSINGLRTKNNKPTKVKDYLLLYAKNISNFKYQQQFEEDYNFDHYSLFLEKHDSDNPNDWDVLNLDAILCRKFKVKKASDIYSDHVKKFILDNYKLLYSSQPVADRLDRVAFSLKNPDRVTIYINPDKSETYMYKKRILDPLADKFQWVGSVLKPLKLVGDLWTDISYTGIDKEGGVKLVGGKKPEKLIKRIIDTILTQNGVVLDFHLGSGTTCAVAHKLGRQYIGIEQLDYGDDDSVVRLENVINGDQSGISKSVNWQGGGDFVYMELAKWNEAWVEKIEKAKTGKELTKLWDEMKETAFLSYKVDPKAIDANVKDFADLSIADQKKFLIECLDKNQLYVNLSEIEDKEYGVSKEDIKLNKEFYE